MNLNKKVIFFIKQVRYNERKKENKRKNKVCHDTDEQ